MAAAIRILQDFARRVKEPRPASLLVNDDTVNDLLGYVEEACERISREYDWRTLVLDGRILTDTVSDTYPLPDGFERITTPGIYMPSAGAWLESESDDEYYRRKMAGMCGDTANRYRLAGEAIRFTFPFSPNIELQYGYKSRHFVKSHDLIGNAVWTDRIARDDDEILLDSELIILGAKAARSIEGEAPHARTDIDAYQYRLELLKNDDKAKMRGNAFGSALDTRALTVARAIATGGGSY